MARTAQVGTRRVLVVAAFFSGCFQFSGPAHAGGWFAGAGGGASAWRHYALLREASQVENADRAGLGFGGYRITKHFSLAAAAIDLGAMTAEGPAFNGFEERLEATGYSAVLMGIIPLRERLGLFGTFGAFHWRQKARYRDPKRTDRLTSRGNSPCYGLGLNYYLTRASTWGVHAEWTRYLDVGDEEITRHSDDIDLFTVGIVYSFPTRNGRRATLPGVADLDFVRASHLGASGHPNG